MRADNPTDESPVTPTDESTLSTTDADESAAADLTQGYTICLNVMADGTFSVYREPLEASGEAEHASTSEYASLDSIELALKAILKLFKENPVGDNSEQAAMEASFAHQRAGSGI